MYRDLPPAWWYDPEYDPYKLESDYEEDPDFGRDEIDEEE